MEGDGQAQAHNLGEGAKKFRHRSARGETEVAVGNRREAGPPLRRQPADR
jgi:hypothetical protein